MKTQKIQAYLLRIDDEGQQYQGYLAEVLNSLEAEQEYVSGCIQVIRLTDEIDCIINDDGKLLGLPPNRLWKSNDDILDFVVGNIQCVRHDDEGMFTSILPEDIKIIESMLVPIKEIHRVEDNVVFVTMPAMFLPEWGGEDDGSKNHT